MSSQRDFFSLGYSDDLSQKDISSAVPIDEPLNAAAIKYSVLGNMRVGTHGFGCIQKQGERVIKVTMPFDKVCPLETYGKFKLAIVDIADLGLPSLQTNASANRFFDHFKTVFLDLINQLKNNNISYEEYTKLIQDNLFTYEQIYITETLEQIERTTLLSDAYDSVNTFWQEEFMEKIFLGDFDPENLETLILELNERMEALTDYLNLVSKFMDDTPGSSSVRLTTYKNYGKYAKTPFAKKIYSTTPLLLKNLEDGSMSEWNAFFDIFFINADGTINEAASRKFCAFDFGSRQQNGISLLPNLEPTVLYESPRVPREFITSNIDLLQSALSVQEFSSSKDVQENQVMLYQDGSCYHSRLAYKNGDRYAFTDQLRIMEGIETFKKKTKNSIELRPGQVAILAENTKQRFKENKELSDVLFDGLKLYKDIQKDFINFTKNKPDLCKLIGKPLLKLINIYHTNALYKNAKDLEELIEKKYPGELYQEEGSEEEEEQGKSESTLVIAPKQAATEEAEAESTPVIAPKQAEVEEGKVEMPLIIAPKADEGFRRPIFKQKVLVQPPLIQPGLIQPFIKDLITKKQKTDPNEPNEFGGSIRKKTRNKRNSKKRKTMKRRKGINQRKRRKTKKHIK